jgi:hypothetical protein
VRGFAKLAQLQESGETTDVPKENEVKESSQLGTTLQEPDHLSTATLNSISGSNINNVLFMNTPLENLQSDIKSHLGKRQRGEEDSKDLCRLCLTPLKDNSLDGICSQCTPSKQQRSL